MAQSDSSNASSTNDRVGWQDSPGRRGTWNIIQSCAVTIAACTWTIQHLNIPGATDGWWTKKFRSCQWMLLTILLPEFILAHAVFELVLAVQGLEALENAGAEVKYPWWLFRKSKSKLNGDDGAEGGESGKKKNKEEKAYRWTLTHSYFANMGGFLCPVGEEKPDTFQRTGICMTAQQMAAHWEKIEHPRFTEDELKDKGKGDIFTRLVAIFQISQLVVSLSVRQSKGLPYAQVETMTLVYAVCGVFTYFVTWYKPKDVDVSFSVLPLNDENGEPRLRKEKFRRTFDSFWKVVTNKLGDHHQNQPVSRIPNDNIPIESSPLAHSAVVVLAVLSAGVGCFHILSWWAGFPTRIEKIFWHVSTIVSIATPPVGLLGVPLSQITWSWGNPRTFMHDCSSVMHELAWSSTIEERREILQKRRALENVYMVADKSTEEAMKDFSDVIGKEWLHRMLDYVQKRSNTKDEPPLNVRPRFSRQLTSLIDLVEGKGPKKLTEEAKTNVFPRTGIPIAVNGTLVFVTGILYCLARVALFAVALSSLRSMPSDVYRATWAKYIPSVQ